MIGARTLGSVIQRHGGLIQTGPFGSQLHQADYAEEGTPVVMPRDIRGGRIDESSVARIPEVKAQALARHLLREGSIVFPRRGDVSKCAYVGREQEGFLCGTGCLKIEVPSHVLSARFLFYYLGLPHVVQWLERNAVGTTMLNLNSSIMAGVLIPDLTLLQQEEVVRILASYDNLIETNRRRIALLEQAARLLYEEWFVRLRFPRHEHVKVKDGVPDGWERRMVPEIVWINPPEPTRKGDVISYLPMAALSESGMTVNIHQLECRDAGTSVKFRNHDTLLARITPCLENGKTAYVNFLNDGEVACGSTEFIVLRGMQVSSYFTYCLARTYDFREHAIKSMVGSSGRQRVQVSCFDEFALGKPPESLLDLFDESAAPCFGEIENLMKQNVVLARARDLLLPRLMNGEIAV